MTEHEQTVMNENASRFRAQAEHEGETARMVREFDPVADATTRVTYTHSAEVHASTLNSFLTRRPMQARQSLLRLQRTHGNRYVQRVLALARKGEGEAEVAPEVESVIERARGGGQALEGSLRRKMESAFGADFSNVRVHTNAEADELNHAVSALAFTKGQDIFFRSGFYQPTTSNGQELLAHELTHVMQQGGANRTREGAIASIQRMCSACEEEKEQRLQRKLMIGQPDDQYELEADQVARALAHSHTMDNRFVYPLDFAGELSKYTGEPASSSPDARCDMETAPCEDDPLADFQGSGETRCDTSSGTMVTSFGEHCAGDCVAQHEAVHRADRGDCCRKVKQCLDNAPDDAGKNACVTTFNNWFPQLSNWTECNAYTREVSCLNNFITNNCSVSGGPVSDACCQQLRSELAFAQSQQTSRCANAVFVPCPF